MFYSTDKVPDNLSIKTNKQRKKETTNLSDKYSTYSFIFCSWVLSSSRGCSYHAKPVKYVCFMLSIFRTQIGWLCLIFLPLFFFFFLQKLFLMMCCLYYLSELTLSVYQQFSLNWLFHALLSLVPQPKKKGQNECCDLTALFLDRDGKHFDIRTYTKEGPERPCFPIRSQSRLFIFSPRIWNQGKNLF